MFTFFMYIIVGKYFNVKFCIKKPTNVTWMKSWILTVKSIYNDLGVMKVIVIVILHIITVHFV